MRFFLDVNVIMEFFANRDYSKEAKRILKGAEQGMYTGFISAMTFITLNVKDFIGEHEEKVPVYSLVEFVKKFIEL